MNIFTKKLFRSKVFTSLTILFMAAAVALLSIGICAWRETYAQLERVGAQYTTIAVPNPYTFTPAILWREGDKTWLPLTRQERKYRACWRRTSADFWWPMWPGAGPCPATMSGSTEVRILMSMEPPWRLWRQSVRRYKIGHIP